MEDILSVRIYTSTKDINGSNTNSKDARSVSLLLDGHMKCSELRKIAALATGITVDLAEKLRIELWISAGTLSSRPAKPHNHKAKKALKSPNVKSATSQLLLGPEHDSKRLAELPLSENDEVRIVNWNKIGSGRKWEIARHVHLCYNREQTALKTLVSFINGYDALSPDDKQREFASGGDHALDALYTALGAQLTPEGCLFPQERKSRRLQLFLELMAEYEKVHSVLRSASYASESSQGIRPSGEHEEEELKAVSAPVPGIVIRQRSEPRNAGFGISMSIEDLVDEKTGIPHSFDALMDEKEDSQGPRRRENKRRRRRESRRVLAMANLRFDSEMLDDSEFNSLRYEDLVELENVSVGVPKRILESLPVQRLCKFDLQLMAKRSDASCMICLGEYTEGDEVMRLPCLHVYHKRCISKWLSGNTKCPQDMVAVDDSASF